MKSNGQYRDRDAGLPELEDPSADEADEDLLSQDGAEIRRIPVLAEGHGRRLDQLLAQAVAEFSRSHLQQLINQGCVRVDGVVAHRPSARLRAGQGVDVELRPTAQSLAFRPEPVELDILHEDEHLLVLLKPVGRVVHPAPGNWSGTLLNGLLWRYPASASLPRAGIVHRLDKDTSGLMVVARTLQAATALSRDIALRKVGRQYIGIAHGVLPAGERDVVARVGRDPASRVRMAVVSSGREARTTVQTLHGDGDFTAVRCRLHTGRTHQIRVHLAHIGHPLVADALYGGRPALGLGRQALHAERLSFTHPVGQQALEFHAQAPADLAHAWSRLGAP